MSGIIGSKLNHRGSGIVAKLGTDGQLFTSSGAGVSQAFETAAAAGGITAASQWRITAGFAGDADPISANWEETDAPTGFGVLGSSITESSGVFTFPSTGYWLIMAQIRQYSNSAAGWGYANIKTTDDDSTYATATNAAAYAASGHWQTAVSHYIFDVTDTTTHKCRIGYWQFTNNSNTIDGDTNFQRSGVTFIRLGDT
jgi:hypothetical protein|tara:strand:- start:183 stop:779 length:597 start_codon:yes stop_codon:yes gene_type:complete